MVVVKFTQFLWEVYLIRLHHLLPGFWIWPTFLGHRGQSWPGGHLGKATKCSYSWTKCLDHLQILIIGTSNKDTWHNTWVFDLTYFSRSQRSKFETKYEVDVFCYYLTWKVLTLHEHVSDKEPFLIFALNWMLVQMREISSPCPLGRASDRGRIGVFYTFKMHWRWCTCRGLIHFWNDPWYVLSTSYEYDSKCLKMYLITLS
jgi:hypothetical protein